MNKLDLIAALQNEKAVIAAELAHVKRLEKSAHQITHWIEHTGQNLDELMLRCSFLQSDSDKGTCKSRAGESNPSSTFPTIDITCSADTIHQLVQEAADSYITKVENAEIENPGKKLIRVLKNIGNSPSPMYRFQDCNVIGANAPRGSEATPLSGRALIHILDHFQIDLQLDVERLKKQLNVLERLQNDIERRYHEDDTFECSSQNGETPHACVDKDSNTLHEILENVQDVIDSIRISQGTNGEHSHILALVTDRHDPCTITGIVQRPTSLADIDQCNRAGVNAIIHPLKEKITLAAEVPPESINVLPNNPLAPLNAPRTVEISTNVTGTPQSQTVTAPPEIPIVPENQLSHVPVSETPPSPAVAQAASALVTSENANIPLPSLEQQLQQGIKLRHVDQEKRPIQTQSGPYNDTLRQKLHQIRQGVANEEPETPSDWD